MPPSNPFKAKPRSGRNVRGQLLSLLAGGAVLLLVSMALLFFHSHHKYFGNNGSSPGNEGVPAGWPPLRHVKNKYTSPAAQKSPPPPPLPAAEVVQNQLAAIDRWAAALDSEQQEAEQPHESLHATSYHNPLPPDKSIHEVIDGLFLLGQKSPEKLLQVLREENPLGLPRSTQDPLNETLFACPSSRDHLLALPDLVDHARARAFRAEQPGSWLLYQHLRKAGGTGFCDLAKKNLGPGQTPPYYCMVDNKGSLATPPWNQEQKVLGALARGGGGGFRVTSNEWDLYERRMGAWAGAVLATTFRHPVDRWYSQYRFEHLEHRDGSRADAPRRPFRVWYQNNHGYQMGSNYYTTTFIGEPAESAEQQTRDLASSPRKYQDFYWTYHHFQNKPLTLQQFRAALATVRGFHVVLVTEWLNSASGLLDEVLGWKVPPRRVLPHQSQAKRQAGDMDAAEQAARQSGHDAVFESYVEEAVGAAVYREVSLDNVFDILLFHCAKRLYLERLRDCASSALLLP